MACEPHADDNHASSEQPLVYLGKKIVAANRKFKLYCISPDLREVFRLRKVDARFDIYPDKQVALDKF